ncbi:hypothetical protein QF030_006061 [Streptomyces rishiriensis]|uniref:Uncharacterized protein n=1 Tax=Streptomyces rishiriensis TaxID=68264 RepID=A0ABU0NYW9_STRRH|nr:hypothetical protein [Streptomyces rishiriensis]
MYGGVDQSGTLRPQVTLFGPHVLQRERDTAPDTVLRARKPITFPTGSYASGRAAGVQPWRRSTAATSGIS